MKKTIHIIFLISIGIYVMAQTPMPKNKPTYDDYPVHFGFALGLNAMDFSFKRHYVQRPSNSGEYRDSVFADVSSLSPGFQINIVTDFRLSDYFRIRILPGIVFGGRDVNFIGRNNKTIDTLKTESNLIDIPILFKYRAKRVNNYAPYMIAGFAGRYDLQANGNDSERISNKFDIYYEFGAGIDFYLPFFKLSTELKMSVGMLDVYNHNFTFKGPLFYGIDRLSSNSIFLTFYFE